MRHAGHCAAQLARITRWIVAITCIVSRADAQRWEGGPELRAEYMRWIETYPSFDDDVTRARIRAWEQLGARRMGPRLASILPAPGGAGTFTPLGPFGLVQENGFFFSAPQAEGGRVAAIAIDPSRRNTIYVGTANGGVWKSTDAGFSWRALTDDQCGMTIGSIVVDPVNTDMVYASTGEPSETSSHGCGILRSIDGGNSWTRLGATTFDRVRIYAIHIDPRTAGSISASTIVAASSSGLWRSTNGGTTWTRAFTGVFSDVIGHPANGAIMYAVRFGQGSGSPGAFFRSVDGGALWTEITGTFPGIDASRIELAVSASRPDAVYAIAGRRSNSTLLGVYRWEESSGMVDLGTNGLIFPTNRIDFGAQTGYDLAIAVDPVDANRIYVAGVRAFRSIDGGASYVEMAPTVHVDWHVIRIDPADRTRVFVGNDGGIFASLDRTESFQSRNYGISTQMFYPGIAVHPSNAAFVLGGLQDNGTIRAGAFSIYEGVSGGDGGFAAINPNDPSVFWTTCQRAAAQGCLWRHTSTGRSVRRNGIDVNDRHPFIAPLVMSPNDPTRLYYATQRLWRTTDEGLLWTAQSVDLTKGTGTIAAIAEAPGNANYVYVGTNDGNLWVSDNATSTWRGPATGLPDRALTDVAIDAADPLRAWVAIGGFGSSHLFSTANAGVSWTDAGAGLPDVPASAVLAVPGTTRVYVGTDLGVYESLTGAPPWVRVPGLPMVRTTDLIYQPRFNLVIAGTYGRGLWGLNIGTQSTVLRGDVDQNGVVNPADALLIQQAVSGQALPPALALFPYADANCDGTVSVTDAVLVLRFSVGASVNGACVGTIR
ncbi:MAG TPA: dockerin type I domain-containing protein [Gemmatimonadaceae bacterium]|nr:dockerin type I domain-containing protein [Gemmatimonadaceae bacterium]